MAGKGIKNDKQKAAILGSIAGAQHVRLMAKHYGIPVIIHSDHCAKKLLEWFDGMLEADEAYFKVFFKKKLVCQNLALFTDRRQIFFVKLNYSCISRFF